MAKELTVDRGETSQSTSVCETVNGSHRFTIKGFSLAKGMGPGKCLASDTFAVGGYQWAIYFFPDGKSSDDNSAYVSAFVALVSEGTDVRALFELTLLDQSGKGKHKVHSHFDRAMESGPYTLKYRGSMWGYKRFFRRTSLEASDFLKDDCLIMNCTIGVVRTRTEKPRQLSISMPTSDMGHCLEQMLTSGAGSDIVFEVDDETFQSHKLILAARSPVFKAQFFGPVGDSKIDRVIVQDIEPLIFKAMLQFIYTDELPNFDELVGLVPGSLETNLVQHLLAAADQYGLERLKLLCEEKLCEQITVDTVASTLALAEDYHCPHLKTACLKFTADSGNLKVVLRSEGFCHIRETCPSLLVDLLATVASVEEDVKPVGQKRTSSSTVGLNLTGVVDPGARRTRRRL